MSEILLLPIVLPVCVGLGYLLSPETWFSNRKRLVCGVGAMMVLCAICSIVAIFGLKEEYQLFSLVQGITLTLHIDDLGRLFAVVTTLVMVLVLFFSFGYMAHEEHEKRFYGFYFLTYGVLMGLDFSGNVVTMYLFYEFMTLATFPLVLHTGTKEAIMAGLKYLFYSFCGAYMALFGIYFLHKYADITDFIAGGSLDLAAVLADCNTGFMLVIVFLLILGFGVKAGMFPLHAWLPTAHPVAPAPASALLSGIVVKGGVLAIIRMVFYVVGADFIKGTWVQTAWLALSLITVLMGSALAYKERVFKKRLAYSTVSNLSYILFGLALLNPVGMTGSLLHVIFHAIIKSCLFLCAGAIIVTTGKTKVAELSGVGKQMPVLMWCFTFASLALIGIPPTSGVVSKWYLCTGAMEERISVVWWLGPVVLLISALLTAGYLLPVSINSFMGEASVTERKEPKVVMLIPIILLAVLTLLLGLYPAPIVDFISGITAGLM